MTWVINWLIKPFTMYGIAFLFFFTVFKAFIAPGLATEYLASVVLLSTAQADSEPYDERNVRREHRRQEGEE